MAVSDVFIAKRMQFQPIEWTVIEAFKVNYGYDMKFTVKAIIDEKMNATLQIGEGLQVKGDFAAIRRRHLDGIRVPCGLIVGHSCQFPFKKRKKLKNLILKSLCH